MSDNNENITKEELIDSIVKMEFATFDVVKNEGGRANCQDNFPVFSVMRKSQYLAWNMEMLESYFFDFSNANKNGWNLITEKYGRMMESTVPEEYEKIKDELPPVSDKKRAIVDQIVEIQVEWMEDFSKRYPKMAGQARSIRTSTDNPYNASYETYLRGELLTYSDRTLALYGQFIVEISQNGGNLAEMIMTNTARLYGYKSLDEAEDKMS